MNKLLTILILAILTILTIPVAQAAEGRNTAAIMGFAAGTLTGWIANDQFNKKPEPQVVRYHDRHEYRDNRYRRPIVRPIIIQRVEPEPKQYVIIDGRVYEVIQAR